MISSKCDFCYSQNLSLLLITPLEELGLDGSLTFSVEEQKFGEVETIDLVPNGRSIIVTESNKADYARWVAHHRMTASFRKQVIMIIFSITLPILITND
jgi:hypothetical protein